MTDDELDAIEKAAHEATQALGTSLRTMTKTIPTWSTRSVLKAIACRF